MEELRIGDTAIGPGASEVVRLPIARLPTGIMMSLPVYAFRGEEDGPVLLLQGGLHGDELNGIELLRRMLKEDLCRPTRGTVLVVPVLNPFGFLYAARELPDGKDINRSFPGSRRGSLASRVAHVHMSEVFAHVDVAIDFHTGGGQRSNHPQVRYTSDLPQSAELAKAFAAPYWFSSKKIPKSFRHAAAKLEVPVIVFEGGESLRFDRRAIEEGIAGARRVMHHLGLVDAAPVAGESVHLEKAKWVRAGRAGLFTAEVTTGDIVEKGDILGVIHDPYNEREHPVKASAAGHVISLNHLPIMHRGDALARIGVPGAAPL